MNRSKIDQRMNAVPAKHLYLYASQITSPSAEQLITLFYSANKKPEKERNGINAETTYRKKYK